MQINSIAVFPEVGFLDKISVLYAPLETYVTGVMPLMFQHVWWRQNNNYGTALQELRLCAWIGRLITLDNRVQDPLKENDVAGWVEIRNELIGKMERCKKRSDCATMIKDCMQLVMPVLESRFVKKYTFPQMEFYCWWYTLHEDNTHMALHLVNAYQPESPFDHLDHFISSMFKAVDDAVGIHPEIKKVSCGSWLNDVPRFLQLWPNSYQLNKKILNSYGGFGPGVWGQYMTVNGGFNDRKAAILRSTGLHPHPLSESYCSVDELVHHLNKIRPPKHLNSQS